MSAEDRRECLALVNEAHASGARKELACELLGVDRRTLERWADCPKDLRQGPLKTSRNALTAEERAVVLATANSSKFANLPPGQIVPLLADEGIYLASESTFYRLLKKSDLLAHRSRAKPRQHKRPIALLATEPNQIWSWDITYLRAGIRGSFYYLYLPMDIFSRMIVHWEVNEIESADLAAEMIERACVKEKVLRGQLKLHSDNGGPMKGATMLATLERLGVAGSRSRPRVSDDNPFSEALFKTLKYCPSYPTNGRFDSIAQAREWVGKFVDWYNDVHLHSGINWVTPASKHRSLDAAILEKRDLVYKAAQEKTPTRWSRGTRDWSRVKFVELNPGRNSKKEKIICQQAS